MTHTASFVLAENHEGPMANPLKKTKFIAILAVFVAVGTIGYVVFTAPSAPEARPSAGPAEAFAKNLEAQGFEIVDMKFTAEPAAVSPDDAVTTSAEVMARLDPSRPHGMMPAGQAPIHTPVVGFNPDDQPRGFWSQDFASLGGIPHDYKANGIQIGERGMELAAGDGPRVGSVESPVTAIEFPYNAIAPLWKAETPDGTSVVFEYAVSPDGSNWSGWQMAEEIEEEASPTLPDGRPNPNHSYTHGQIMHGDESLFKYMRFRLTLATDTGASPAVAGIKFYVQDTTLGQGRLADEARMREFARSSGQ